MGEHFTRNTVSAEAWCAKCQKRTQHRVDDVKLGPCLDCIARLDEAHSGIIICRGRHTVEFCMCGRQGDFLCDWKVPDRKSGTCDKPICSKHAKKVGPEKHLCPFHQLQYETWKRKHPEKVAAVEVGVQESLFDRVSLEPASGSSNA